VEAAGGGRVKDGRIPLGETGIPLGDAHHRCTVSDAQVLSARYLREFENLPIPEIARRLRITLRTCRAIVYYERRNVVPRAYRKVVEHHGFAQAMRGAEEAAGDVER
jgi:hypothetical protein